MKTAMRTAGALALGYGALVIGLAVARADGDGPAGALPEATRVVTPHFATSIACALCHASAPHAQGLKDEVGRSVAPFELWRSSMMANATRDPLWRAVVSLEVAATPSRAAEIQAKCLRCHAPMASVDAALTGEAPLTLDVLRGDGPRAQLALDGVSCTVCHQIQPDGLGAPESFSGNFTIRPEQRIFGPHAEPLEPPMVTFTGFRPEQGTHVLRSAMCATCHTLFTDAVRADGTPTGERLPEQTPYLEWRNSVFQDEADPGPQAASCQACHLPREDEDGALLWTRIARNPGGGDFRIPRRELGRHLLVGGNTLVLSMLRDEQETLRPLAPPEAFQKTIDAARLQLRTKTARVWLGEVTRAGGVLRIPARVENLTGHKLPTGHPTRRLWLRLRVRDAAGRVVFASGEHDAEGRIVGADGAPLASERAGGPHQPHRQVIRRPDEVQIYEALMADETGAVTYLLTRAGSYTKDDRLLPAGWRADHPDAEPTRPRGVDGDPDFTAGSDAVLYEVALGGAQGPFTVEATVLYQPLGARYAAEILRHDTPEVRELRGYYQRADKRPELVAETTVRVP